MMPEKGLGVPEWGGLEDAGLLAQLMQPSAGENRDASGSGTSSVGSIPPSVGAPETPSAHENTTFAAPSLSPSYPHRAAWGTAQSLRAWQKEALEAYFATLPADFMTVATPGAGKTTFALRLAAELISRGEVKRVTVVCPTQHLKGQWASAAARVGISLDPAFANAQRVLGAHFDGMALTYAQIASDPQLHAQLTREKPTLVIFDEIHHAGSSLSWGDGIRTAYSHAKRRLCLTGTPFRSDAAPIPFVDYEEVDGEMRSRADYVYGYGEALRDHVVRPVMFMSYSGDMHWRSNQGEEYAARLGDAGTKDIEKQAWRTALDPSGRWIRQVLEAADARLSEVRKSIPDAGGLVIASNQHSARDYARILEQITGQTPSVVLSDEAEASERIDTFAADFSRRWLVAVRMVSEGVDVPRLCVGVYATSASTPLYFAQAVGRFVRSRRRGEVASIFLPSVPVLLGLAAQMEEKRDHVLVRTINEEPIVEEILLEQANQVEKASNELGGFAALGSGAEFDSVLFDGGQFGLGAAVGSVEEQEFLGIPGLLDADQVATLLHERQAEQVKKRHAELEAEKLRAANAGLDEHRRREKARKELQSLVAKWSRVSGRPHGVIHNQLREECGGPVVAQATSEQIEARAARIRGWFVGMK